MIPCRRARPGGARTGAARLSLPHTPCSSHLRGRHPSFQGSNPPNGVPSPFAALSLGRGTRRHRADEVDGIGAVERALDANGRPVAVDEERITGAPAVVVADEAVRSDEQDDVWASLEPDRRVTVDREA